MADVIYVVVKMQAKAGKEEALRKLIEPLVGPTRREKGCLRYEVIQDRQNPAILGLLEEWETQADLQTHLGLPHLQSLFTQLPELLAAPAEIGQYKKIA